MARGVAGISRDVESVRSGPPFRADKCNTPVSESTWWREELWWEKGLFQLGGSSISARQLGTLAVISTFAFLASLPVGFSIDGISFAGRLMVFGLIVLIGYFGLAQRRVKAVPLELQLFFWMTKGRAGASAKPAKPGIRKPS